MAIVFELYIECLEKPDAEQIIANFSSIEPFTLQTGKTIKLHSESHRGNGGEFGVVVYTNAGSHTGIEEYQDALSCTETGLRLYKLLQSAPNFDFAYVGFEAETESIVDLPSYVSRLGFKKDGTPSEQFTISMQCVLSLPLYEKLERPLWFRKFRPGYMWNRYRGEEYHPLYKKDQVELNELCKSMFPEKLDVRFWI
jgi:hypothetical protein